MTEPSDKAPVAGRDKIFPRNLTARADPVLGNPVSTRPESGVDNTHPGLEFDQRNLDRFFFPGLTFGFQFLDGARVLAINPARLQSGHGLRSDDAGTDLCLWYVYGCFGAAPSRWKLQNVLGVDGYDVLRMVRDLERGNMLVIIGRHPTQADLPELATYTDLLNKLWDGKIDLNQGIPSLGEPIRDGQMLMLAALAGPRTEFLTQGGVLDPEAVPAGELTRSLCAPWQWDFADCGCHYWASNKPDIVIGGEGEGEGEGQILNFQRNRPQSPPAAPATTYAEWTADLITQQDMIHAWNTLPFVINETETDHYNAADCIQKINPLSKAEIAAQLTYLATIEHALVVQYLYAHYSIDAPMHLPGSARGTDEGIRFQAAEQILEIAIDEMRHFRWVNEALVLLEQPLSLGRAREIKWGNGQRRKFVLRPLSPKLLQFFIDVEAPSRRINDPNQIDGMYTRILQSLQETPGGMNEGIANRLREVVKVIVEEGHRHWERLNQVKHLLGPQEKQETQDYLQLDRPRKERDPLRRGVQQLADSYYGVIIGALKVVFDQHPLNRGEMLRHARRSMHNLHELAHAMAKEKITPLFHLSPRIYAATGKAGISNEQRMAAIAGLRTPLIRPLHELIQSGHADFSPLATRHAAAFDQMIADMQDVARRKPA